MFCDEEAGITKGMAELTGFTAMLTKSDFANHLEQCPTIQDRYALQF